MRYGGHLAILKPSPGKAIDAITELLTGWNPGAFYNEVTPSFSDVNRTFTLTPIGAYFEFFVKGVLYTKNTAQNLQITNTTGMHYIVYDGATLTETTLSDWIDAIKNKTKCLVAAIYWNATHQVSILRAAEPHTHTISGADHYWKHHTIGTRFGGGLTLSIASNNWQLNVTEGSIFDEDVEIFIKDNTTDIFSQNLSVLESKKLYREGAAEWHYDNAIPSNIVYLSGANKVYHNVNTAGTWSLAETAVNKYSAMWLIATNDFDNPVICLMGQGESGTLSEARAGNDYADMNLSGLPTPEFRLLGRVIVKCLSVSPYYEITEIEEMQSDDIIPGSDVTNDSYVTGIGFDAPTNTLSLYRNNGLSTLQQVIPAGGYTLPIATDTILGGVKIGTGINGDSSGLIWVETNYQAPLNGTGFVKISGTTISYDNNTYDNYSGWMLGTGSTYRKVQKEHYVNFTAGSGITIVDNDINGDFTTPRRITISSSLTNYWTATTYGIKYGTSTAGTNVGLGADAQSFVRLYVVGNAGGAAIKSGAAGYYALILQAAGDAATDPILTMVNGSGSTVISTNAIGNMSLQGSLQVGNDTRSADAGNVGTIRYRVSGNNSYCEMSMQTGASTYAWVVIKQNTW